MTKTLSAVYENGLLRPSEPLPLSEHQRVSVTVSDVTPDPADAWLDHEYMAMVDAMDEPVPTLDEVRRILSKISGNLSDTIRAERDARG
jgi:predicted DNA-binding antitoxin AbrB/MazE fold protein